MFIFSYFLSAIALVIGFAEFLVWTFMVHGPTSLRKLVSLHSISINLVTIPSFCNADQ